MPKQIDFANALRTTIWRTMGARFNAVRRLRRRDRLSNFSIAAFSVLAIALTFLQKVYGFPTGTLLDNHYTALAFVISLFVLIISLLEGAGAYSLRAERLNQNAIELNAMQKRLGHLISLADDGEALKPNTLDEINKAYEDKIKQCPENHEPIDDLLFQVQHRKSPEFSKASISWVVASRIRIAYFFYSVWLFIIAWSAMVILVGSLIAKLLR